MGMTDEPCDRAAVMRQMKLLADNADETSTSAGDALHRLLARLREIGQRLDRIPSRS
jgi:hypothetical protein